MKPGKLLLFATITAYCWCVDVNAVVPSQENQKSQEIEEEDGKEEEEKEESTSADKNKEAASSLKEDLLRILNQSASKEQTDDKTPDSKSSNSEQNKVDSDLDTKSNNNNKEPIFAPSTDSKSSEQSPSPGDSIHSAIELSQKIGNIQLEIEAGKKVFTEIDPLPALLNDIKNTLKKANDTISEIAELKDTIDVSKTICYTPGTGLFKKENINNVIMSLQKLIIKLSSNHDMPPIDFGNSTENNSAVKKTEVLPGTLSINEKIEILKDTTDKISKGAQLLVTLDDHISSISSTLDKTHAVIDNCLDDLIKYSPKLCNDLHKSLEIILNQLIEIKTKASKYTQ